MARLWLIEARLDCNPNVGLDWLDSGLETRLKLKLARLWTLLWTVARLWTLLSLRLHCGLHWLNLFLVEARLHSGLDCAQTLA